MYLNIHHTPQMCKPCTAVVSNAVQQEGHRCYIHLINLRFCQNDTHWTWMNHRPSAKETGISHGALTSSTCLPLSSKGVPLLPHAVHWHGNHRFLSLFPKEWRARLPGMCTPPAPLFASPLSTHALVWQQIPRARQTEQWSWTAVTAIWEKAGLPTEEKQVELWGETWRT